MQRLQFLSSVTLSSSGQTPAFSVGDVKQGAVTLTITSATGTTPTLTMFLQESDDGGTTWYDVAAARTQKTTASGTEESATLDDRNICTDAAVAGYFRAHYDSLDSDYYRLKYVIGGTGPQFVVTASLNAK